MEMRHEGTADGTTLVARGPSLIRWAAVFAGAIVGFALFALLTALWVALAYRDIGGGAGSDNINIEGIEDNLEWFIAGSGAFAMLAGGFFTGWFTSLRGAGVGALNGFVGWGATVVATVVFGVPSVLGAFSSFGSMTGDDVLFGGLWAAFWTLAGGLVLAVLGGLAGGTARRPAWLFEPQAVDMTEMTAFEDGYTARPVSIRIGHVATGHR